MVNGAAEEKAFSTSGKVEELNQLFEVHSADNTYENPECLHTSSCYQPSSGGSQERTVL